MPKFHDLRQGFYEGMPYIRAGGAPSIKARQVVRPSDAGSKAVVSLTDLDLNTHLGTHVDVPRHVYADGKAIDDYTVEAFVGSGIVLDFRTSEPEPITSQDLAAEAGTRIRPGDIVLIRTGWATRFGDPDNYRNHPYLADDAAEWLVERSASMVGIDVMSPDMPEHQRPPGYGMPVHRVLLGGDALIIENVGELAPVVGMRVQVSALPLLILGADGSPSALFAWTD